MFECPEIEPLQLSHHSSVGREGSKGGDGDGQKSHFFRNKKRRLLLRIRLYYGFSRKKKEAFAAFLDFTSENSRYHFIKYTLPSKSF